MNLYKKELALLQYIPQEKLPEHICIIPDGNGRWAKKHKKTITEGHKKGFYVAREIISMLSYIPQVKIVTVWGFSHDNWKRSSQEVAGLMQIFTYLVKIFLKKAKNKNIRFIHLGSKENIPISLKKLLQFTEEMTNECTGQTLALALDFSGEDQIVRMLQQVCIQKNIQITPEAVWSLRDGKGFIRAADLLIRTSGELRTSDIGWLNGARTELYFTPKFFPDIEPMDIVKAILDFSRRERRMGARK